MKLWRKLAKKETSTEDFVSVWNVQGEVIERVPMITRNGRSIKNQIQMSEYFTKRSKRSYPLLDALFKKAGIQYTLTAKQQEALKTMIENANSDQYKETVDETK